WIHRHRSGLSGVTTDLKNTSPQTKIDPDPDPIRYLRRYSNFITPKVGLLSADTWTFVAIYLRNLLLNWLIFIPAILSGLMLPRLIVALTTPPNSFNLISQRLAFLDAYTRPSFFIAGFVCAVLALAYIMFNRPTVREELRQASAVWRR